MSNFVEESVNQVNQINPGVDVDPVLNGVRNRERNFHRNQRTYKHNQNGRNEVNNVYQYSGTYQNQQYSSNWGENVPFDQTRISNFSTNYPSNFQTNATSYPNNANAYPSGNSGYPTTGSTYPNNGATNYAGTTYTNTGTTNSNYVQAYTTTMPLVGDGRMQPMPMSNSQVMVNQMSQSTSLEEIAHVFTFKYYSLFNTNPTFMYTLYSKEAQVSKTDLNGNRVVAGDHNEIRNYYQQFANYVVTSKIQNIEIQLVGGQPLFLVLITGSLTLANEKDNFEQTKHFAQSVVLAGDVTRSRYHIINDLFEEISVTGTKTTTTETTYNTVNEQPVEPKQLTQETPPESSRMGLKKESKDGMKLAIFGIPPMVTEVILKDLINQRLMQLKSEGKVVDVAVKPQKVNRKTNESLLYAFVELDSEEAVETLLANDFQIQDRNITMEPYKRTDKKREFRTKNLPTNY